MRHDHHAPQSASTRLIFGLAGALLATGAATAAPAGDPTSERGIWLNHSGKGAVEIRPCGASGRDANRLCGFIVWLKQPNNKKGEPLHDGYNENPSKRHRPICGLPVLGSLRPMSDGSWDQGWVYDPEQGKSFDAAIQLKSSDRLILTGYKGVKFFSKSFLWKRAPADLPRCDTSPDQREARATVPAKDPGLAASTPVEAPDAGAAAAAVAAIPIGAAAALPPPLPNKADIARAALIYGVTPPPPVPAVRPGTALR